MKTLNNSEDHYWNPLQNACCGTQEVACYCKTCSGTRLLLWNRPRHVCIFRQIIPPCNVRCTTNERVRKPDWNSYPDSEQILELVRVFMEVSTVFIFGFLFKYFGTCKKKVFYFNLKKYLSHDIVPLKTTLASNRIFLDIPVTGKRRALWSPNLNQWRLKMLP